MISKFLAELRPTIKNNEETNIIANMIKVFVEDKDIHTIKGASEKCKISLHRLYVSLASNVHLKEYYELAKLINREVLHDNLEKKLIGDALNDESDTQLKNIRWILEKVYSDKYADKKVIEVVDVREVIPIEDYTTEN